VVEPSAVNIAQTIGPTRQEIQTVANVPGIATKNSKIVPPGAPLLLLASSYRLAKEYRCLPGRLVELYPMPLDRIETHRGDA
jgi:hypothetical protein